MSTKHVAPNGKTYTVTAYTVGCNFGTAAEVRRGGFITRTAVFPLGCVKSAVDAAFKLADEHAAK